MVKCVCTHDCYISHERNRPVFYEHGEVVSFNTCPPNHFVNVDKVFNPHPLASDSPDPAAVKKSTLTPQPGKPNGPPDTSESTFDFDNAPEDVLMAAEYDLKLLYEHALTKYGVTLKQSKNKATVVASFVDARYRFVTASAQLNAAQQKMLGSSPTE